MADLQDEIYSIAFGEVVPSWSNYDKEYHDGVLALLTSVNDFPELPTIAVSSNKSSDDPIRRKNQEEWQIICPQNCSFDSNNDSNDDLHMVSRLEDEDEMDKASTEFSTMTASSWQHINFSFTMLSTFSRIASKAGCDHTLISNDRFFKATRNTRRAQTRSTTVNTNSMTPSWNHRDNNNENGIDNVAYDTRGAKRSQKSHYVNLRKQKLNKILLHRRLRSISSTVLKALEEQGNTMGKDIGLIEAKKEKAIKNNCLSPTWSFYKPSYLHSYIYVPKSGFTIDYHCQWLMEFRKNEPGTRRKKEYARSKKNLKAPVKTSVKAATPIWWDISQYGRQVFIKEMEYQGFLVPFPRNSRYRIQQEDLVKAIQEVRQQVTHRVNRKYPEIFHSDDIWLDYHILSSAIKDKENFTYHRQLAQLHGNVQRHVRTSTSVLYNQLPRCYFVRGQRKYRKLNVRCFLQQLDNSSSGIQYSI